MPAGAREPVPMTFLINFVQGFDLKCGSTTGGNHVSNSYHWSNRAVDMYGSKDEMLRLQRKALRTPQLFREAFYDGAERYVKNGRIIRGKLGGHLDHVHLAR